LIITWLPLPLQFLKKGFYTLLFFILALNLKSQIINIETKRFLKDTNGLVGTIGGNFNINQNVQTILTLGFNQHVQYKHNHHRILAISDINFIKASGNDFVNAGYQHFRYNYKVNKLLTWEAFVQGQYNLVLKLDRRYISGTGPRFRILKEENFRIYAASLYMYEYQSQDNERIQQFNHRISSYVSFTINFKKAEFVSTTFYQPSLEDLENFRIANDSAIDMGLGNKLHFRVGFNLLYDTKQPPGVPDLTYILRNGLTYKF
jgi:hypothetical protein